MRRHGATLIRHLRPGARLAAFTYLTAIIAVIGSERLYWYWAGIDPTSLLALAAFYALPVAAALWLLAYVPGRTAEQVVLAGIAYALLVEGVLTPVLYEDGPLPALAVMFVGWHGLITFAGLWYLAHRWLVQRRSRQLLAASAVLGLWWGAWARASSITEPPSADDVAEMGLDPTLLAPAEFALYAALAGAALAASHLLLARVVPVGWRPTRRSLQVLAAVVVACFIVLIVPAVPWAPLKLIPLLWLVWIAMRRGWGGETTALDRLAGPVRIRDAALLLALPATAAATYALLWQVSSTGLLAVVYWGMVGAQAAAGATAVAMVSWRAVRASSSAAPAAGGVAPVRGSVAD